MYHHIMNSLPLQRLRRKSEDLLLQPPEDHPNNIFKQKLIQRTATSEQRLLQQLYTAEELGNWQPMQLLLLMQQLFCKKLTTMDGSIIKELHDQAAIANKHTYGFGGCEREDSSGRIGNTGRQNCRGNFTFHYHLAASPQATSKVENFLAENTSLWI